MRAEPSPSAKSTRLEAELDAVSREIPSERRDYRNRARLHVALCFLV
jgi:hypothetical protein